MDLSKKTGRPVFNQILKKIRQKEAEGIIAWKLDRLSRNPRDSAEIDIMLQEEAIKHIVTPDKECFPKDNVVMRALEFSMANQYIIDLSNNVKRGQKMKLEKGILPGRAPLGYLNYRDEFNNKSIVKDPKTFEILKRMWRLLLEGKRIKDILNTANNEYGLRTHKRRKTGGKPLVMSSIYKIFSNPFYAGIIKRRQDKEIREYKGVHEAMISFSEFEEAQYLLGRENRPRPKRHEFAYTGLIKCGECGGMITAEGKTKRQKNGNIHHYTYYHCTKRKRDVKCQQKFVRQEKIEEQTLLYLDRITIPDKFREWAIKYFDEVKDDSEKEIAKILQSQKQTLQKVEFYMGRLTDLLIDNTLNKEEYAVKKQELTHQKWQLEEKIKQNESNLQKWLEPAKNLIFFINQAKNWFISGNNEEKREIMKTIGSNRILKDRILLFEAKKPFQIMEGFKKIPVMCGQVEDVRTYFVNNDCSDLFSPIIKEKINSFMKSL